MFVFSFVGMSFLSVLSLLSSFCVFLTLLEAFPHREVLLVMCYYCFAELVACRNHLPVIPCTVLITEETSSILQILTSNEK